MYRVPVAAFFVVMLGACGTVDKVEVLPVATGRQQAAALETSFRFVDERPIGERLTSRSDSRAGEVVRLGDDSLSPSGPELLRAKLHEKLDQRLKGMNVALVQFEVQIYDPPVVLNDAGMQGAGAAAGPLGLLLGALVVGGIQRISNDKTVRVSIVARLGPEEVETRTFGSFKGRVSAGNINEVMTKALDDVVQEFESKLSGMEKR